MQTMLLVINFCEGLIQCILISNPTLVWPKIILIDSIKDIFSTSTLTLNLRKNLRNDILADMSVLCYDPKYLLIATKGSGSNYSPFFPDLAYKKGLV